MRYALRRLSNQLLFTIWVEVSAWLDYTMHQIGTFVKHREDWKLREGFHNLSEHRGGGATFLRAFQTNA